MCIVCRLKRYFSTSYVRNTVSKVVSAYRYSYSIHQFIMYDIHIPIVDIKSHNIYLRDGIPSAALIGPTVRQCLWELVESIANKAPSATELPVCFGGNKAKHKKKKQKKLSLRDSYFLFDNIFRYKGKVWVLHSTCISCIMYPVSTTSTMFAHIIISPSTKLSSRIEYLLMIH